MNICRFSTTFLPYIDGMSRHIYYLSKYQAEQGHKVFILQPYLNDEVRDGIFIRRINLGSFEKSQIHKFLTILLCIVAIAKCIKIHKKEHLDIIHCHGDVIEAFFLGLLGLFLRIPVVLTIHGGLNKKLIYQILAPKMFSFIKRFIVVSEDIKLDLLSLGIRSEKVEVISSGINFNFFLGCDNLPKVRIRSELGIPTDVTVIVSTGRLHPVKGYRYLVDSVKLMNNDKKFLFIIVGDGPKRDELLALAKDMPIRFVGEKPSTDIVKYLHSADIFVLPSIELPGQAEGTSTSVMEAMAAGLPVISTDSGGTKYLIKDGENGFIVKQKNSEELAKAIQKLLDNPELRKKMGETNQEKAKEKDWSVIAQRVYEVYKKL